MSTTDSGAAAKTLRVAIIGYGLAGSVFHAPLGETNWSSAARFF